VNEQLGAIVTWLYNNKLCVNHTKSKYMIFQPNNKKDVEDPHIKIGLSSVQDLEQVDTYKYLGVIFDKKLTWVPHIQCICKKSARNVGTWKQVKETHKLWLFFLYLFSSANISPEGFVSHLQDWWCVGKLETSFPVNKLWLIYLPPSLWPTFMKNRYSCKS